MAKPEATSGRNTEVDCKNQTAAKTQQRDCASADEQETVKRLEDENRKLSALIGEYERKIVQMSEVVEHMLQEHTSHIHDIKKGMMKKINVKC
jgi:predicted RNase H-like nuclease (RuvC/YqgF family)